MNRQKQRALLQRVQEKRLRTFHRTCEIGTAEGTLKEDETDEITAVVSADEIIEVGSFQRNKTCFFSFETNKAHSFAWNSRIAMDA